MTTFVVVDIEADGPIPGPHSMLSLGAAAFSINGGIFSDFEINLKPLPDAHPHPATMRWFEAQAPDALAHARRNPEAPTVAMSRFFEWVAGLPAPRVLAACPAPFDFMWVNWYLYKFLGTKMRTPILEPLFSGCALDIATLFADRHNVPFTEMNPSLLPADWYDGHKHSHKAIEDARGYASVLHKMAGSGAVTD